MRKVAFSFSAAALALSLPACGGTDQPDNNVVAEELNPMTNLEELPPAEPTANSVVETPAVEEEAPAANTVPAKPAPAKPAPTTRRPAEPKAPEPEAPDASCLPEHRAAGHC
jgi:hypothetical protein